LLLTRVLTAAALLAAFVSTLWFLDRNAFAAVVAVIVAIGGYEWAALGRARAAMACVYGAACALLFGAIFQFPPLTPWICGFAAVFWAIAVPSWLARGFETCPGSLLPAVGVVVLVPAGLAMANLGPLHVLMVLGLVWAADTAAYFTGRALGKRKLAPAISPGKTWEGVAGAVVASVIYAIIWAQFDPGLVALVQGAAWLPYLAGAVLLCAVSIVGDLFESAAKRRAGVKDSGTLLPGHGGILDRIDSATASLPVALLLMQAAGMATA
jgi:phosphatidate cytidylyltransferase